jgi:hypothetical protein
MEENNGEGAVVDFPLNSPPMPTTQIVDPTAPIEGGIEPIVGIIDTTQPIFIQVWDNFGASFDANHSE